MLRDGSKILVAVAVFIFTACSNVERSLIDEKGAIYNDEDKYVVLNAKNAGKKEEIYITILDENGNKLNNLYFGKSSDISNFKSFKNKLYFYGPGD